MSPPPAQSTTCTLELDSYPTSSDDITAPHSILHSHQSSSKQSHELQEVIQPHPRSSHDEENREAIGDGELEPEGAARALETWKNPGINKWRLAATFWGFIIMGMNDAAPGALIPYLEKYYDLSFTVVSLIFLSPFIGYILSAGLNNWIHVYIGRRGVSVLASVLHLLSYIVIAQHPPYAALVVVMAFAGFGTGCMDAAWNSWVGSLDKANEIMGLLHGFYGLGAILSPIIATSMVTNGKPWYEFYYILIGLSATAIFTSGISFWAETAEKYRTDHPATANKGSRTKEALKEPVTLIIATFLFLYVGAEVSLGGWIVTFMLRVRKSSPFDSGMVSAGFWIGLTVGRFTLGWITGRFGEKFMSIIYLALSIALELLFWLVPQFYVSAISVALLGYFIGPLFPSAIVVQTKLLPPRLHVSAVGFAAAFGGSGAAVFPFMVGAIAQKAGVASLHPMIVALLVAQLGLWVCLPRVPRSHAHAT